MAKTEFTYSCGHEGCVTGRNRADADRQARRLVATPCHECEYQASAAAAAGWAAERGLPDLTGVSVKQIQYGQFCRKSALETYGRGIDQINELCAELPDETLCEVRDALATLIAERIGNTDAGWWIDISNGPEMTDCRRRLLREAAKRDMIPTARALSRAVNNMSSDD